MQRIVVGIDGSDGARDALAWAIGEARLRGATVEAVHAWHVPYGGTEVVPINLDLAALEQGEQSLLEREIGAVETGGVEVQPVLVEGPAAQVLLRQAEGADLLVVGSRGLGGFMGLLLGSVSHQLVHHAPCPVVILPHE